MSHETAAQRMSSSSGPVRKFSVDDVDVAEQVRIHSQLAEDAFEQAVQEALRRSLLDDSQSAVSQPPVMETDAINTNSLDHAVGSASLLAGTENRQAHGDSQVGMLLARGANSAAANSDLSDVAGSSAGASGLSGAAVECDADDEHESVPRSRRGQYQFEQRHKSDRRPSLDRLYDADHMRSPSPDRTTERRPSLDRLQQQSERRPSLDRMRERRPSLEMIQAATAKSERRPSLEGRERRPSLDRTNGSGSERRPSLDRSGGSDRRPSLDRGQGAEGGAGVGDGASADAVQGINTITPLPADRNTGVPINWNKNDMPQRENNELYRLAPLSPMDKEYMAITVDFDEAGLKVFSVERLQNPLLFERFSYEKDHMIKSRHPGFVLNERYLYHGTQANKQRLSEEGLDHRLSFQGCFGRGIYFSDNPRKCMNYASSGSNSGPNGTRPMILVCRVLLGDSKVYANGVKDSDLKKEPEKPNSKGGWRYYDSVQGVPIDYPEFVVYDNRRSMIEYIVTFEEVAYRAPPPSQYNVSRGQASALYKVEPIVLPIPEEELDKLYMLGPDTDSDGSCDEHTREVERLRENVKRGKAKRLGIPFRLPTKEEKRYERLHWKRVCYYSCPPSSPLFEMMIMKKKEEKAQRKKRKQEEKDKKTAEEGGAVGGEVAEGGDSETTAKKDEYDVENESVAEVLSTLIADFLTVTDTDDVPQARRYIMENDMDLDKALSQYFLELE